MIRCRAHCSLRVGTPYTHDGLGRYGLPNVASGVGRDLVRSNREKWSRILRPASLVRRGWYRFVGADGADDERNETEVRCGVQGAGRFGGGLLSVAIIDWLSRAVLAWRLSNTMEAMFRRHWRASGNRRSSTPITARSSLAPSSRPDLKRPASRSAWTGAAAGSTTSSS